MVNGTSFDLRYSVMVIVVRVIVVRVIVVMVIVVRVIVVRVIVVMVIVVRVIVTHSPTNPLYLPPSRSSSFYHCTRISKRS